MAVLTPSFFLLDWKDSLMNPQVFLPLVSGRAPLPPLGLATFNIGYDESQGSSLSAEERVEKIAGQIEMRDAEIVALQEVVSSLGRPELEAFHKRLPDWHFYSLPHNPGQTYRNLILSRFQIVGGSERSHTIRTEKSSERVNLSVQVKLPDGRKIRVFNIHTRANAAEEGTRQSLQWVKQVADSEPGIPYVVMGDFNLEYPLVKKIAKQVGLEVPAFVTTGEIDHMLASDDFNPLDFSIPSRPTQEGQHNPLFATMELASG
jgi:endonuclease/exonuclease/phosphatase family metal-dependent hydrolase